MVFFFLLFAFQEASFPEISIFQDMVRPAQALDLIKRDNPGAQTEKTFGAEEWTAFEVYDLDYVRVGVDKEGIFYIKIRKSKEWPVTDGLAMIQQMGIETVGEYEKTGHRTWQSDSESKRIGVELFLHGDHRPPQGDLYYIRLRFLPEKSLLDKIVFRDGNVLEVDVLETTPNVVKYRYPGETVMVSASKNTINRVIYRSGRIEKGSALPVIRGEQDWHFVILTTNTADVEGLTRVKAIKGKSGWGGTMARGIGNKDARRKLKKAAAKLRAPIVLLQDKPGSVGVSIIGVAYR